MRTRPSVDQRELPEDVRWLQRGEDHLAAVLRGEDDLDPPFRQHEQGVSHVALMEYVFAFR
jgi:hypothetical protein